MSYIIKNSSPFVSVKLTQTGREMLAKGKLNFSSWAIGDSEINYDREAIYDANTTDATLSATTRIMRPFDRQPDIKSFITKADGVALQTLTNANIRTIKATVNNQADERGFFSGTTGSYSTLTGSTYAVAAGTVDSSLLSGGTTLDLGGTAVSEGDLILIKVSNTTLGDVDVTTNVEPIPSLWFKVQSFSSPNATLDRALPNLNESGTALGYIVYQGGEVYDTIGTACTTSYWDSGTLQFDASCDVTCGDVPVWNMNNVWCEDPAGITGSTYEGHEYFGSYDYLGSKHPYFQYTCAASGESSSVTCDGLSAVDGINKSVGLIHYTNNSISNLYGEFFYIDGTNNKNLELELPDLMYHRRDFQTGSGTTMGMKFIASGSTKLIGTDLEYVDLIEDSSLIPSGATPQVVGKVFPQLKTIAIDDEEIVAATSYKSNRSWTLPPLAVSLVAPTGGTSTGLLIQGETMFVTYILDNDTSTGLTTSLPCQKYSRVTNNTSSAKDVEFRIEDVDLLPYMRKTEAGGYDGRGFHAYNFKVLYQIVADGDDTRPDPTAWKVYDYTTTGLTTNASETISPTALEAQNPLTYGFNINKLVNSATTTFDITQSMSLATVASPDTLQFGDERFFYGNINTYIGATIYKTMFDIRINSGLFTNTTNETRSTDASTNPPDIRVSEVGIYDSDNNLVCIGKLSKPVNLLAGSTIMIELSMDF